MPLSADASSSAPTTTIRPIDAEMRTPVKMNGADKRPSGNCGRSPAVESTVMITSWVGRPEQSSTSSAAAARSIGRGW